MSAPADRRIQTSEAARLLGCSVRMVQKLCGSGDLVASRVGARWTTTTGAVDAYLNRHAGAPAPRISAPARLTFSPKSPAETPGDRYARAMGRRVVQ